jgi:hypothetical protein
LVSQVALFEGSDPLVDPDAGQRRLGQVARSSQTRQGRAHSPRFAFTVVEEGETIWDVALRVYGSTGQADTLWRANRDALARKDSPLLAGTLLRTPSLADQSALRK